MTIKNIKNVDQHTSFFAKSNYAIIVFRNIEKLKDIKDFWKGLTYYPYTDFDYFMQIIASNKEFVSPYIILVTFNDDPITLLIGRIKKTDIKIKIGYKNIHKVKTKILEVLYCGILGTQNLDVCNLLIDTIKKSLKAHEADLAYFKYLDVNSYIFNTAKRSAKGIIRDYFSLHNSHWILHLPESYDKFLEERSKSTKEFIRRYTSRLERRMGKRMSVIRYDKTGDLEKIMSEVEQIASKTYQRGLGIGFIDDEYTRNQFSFTLQNNWSVTWILYIDKKPCAFWTGLIYKDMFLSVATGYLTEYKSERLGTYLIVEMIKEFCSDNNLKILDFGFGDADYKKNYSTKNNIESSVYLYAPTLKSYYFNLTNTFSRLLIRGTKLLLRKFKFVRSVKNIWRKKLSN
jgi:hypothetical protein